MKTNIFSTLSKYTSSSENTLTEAFVFCLRLFLERSRTNASQLLQKLCDVAITSVSEIESICIDTQSTIDEGRPDIEIRIGLHTLVFIEVKHDAALGIQQLEKYAASLQQTTYEHKRLILLTRSLSSGLETTLESSQYHHVLWHQIYDWLSEFTHDDEIVGYFAVSMQQFLAEKGMVMQKVSWEYIQGVPALLHLSMMIEEALAEVFPKGKIRRSAGWTWRGFYAPGNYFIGMYYESPLHIVFANNGDRGATYRQELDLEQVLFFALTPDKQYQTLVTFFTEAVNNASPSDVLEVPHDKE